MSIPTTTTAATRATSPTVAITTFEVFMFVPPRVYTSGAGALTATAQNLQDCLESRCLGLLVKTALAIAAIQNNNVSK